MTSVVSSTSACHPYSAGPEPHGDGPEPRDAAVSPDVSSRHDQPELALHRRFVARVTGGLDGAVRVAMLLRGRNYRVRDLTVDVRQEDVLSEIRVTVLLTGVEADLLVKRLQRIPAVVSAAQD